ncbi:MAG: methionyl-tRNA formyltransferase [Candidatus Omnitrophica bacterium]|nr:methionyl-tRNA formyltransferase [Candidatus Omnitrophota bacterium]
MNIVFFGSAHFGLPSLKALLKSGHKVSCVVTQPDRKKGRGMHLAQTPIKTTAEGLKIRAYQPPDINTQDAVRLLKSLNADLFVVIAYGQILSQEVLDIPGIMAVNVHASLLPKYRGAAPINWSIINGDKTCGITVIKLARKMDAGPIILQEDFPVENEANAITLELRLSELAPKLLLETLESIRNRNYTLTAQKNSAISYAPKLRKEDGVIDWKKPAEKINNLVKGCISWPGAYTYYGKKMLKIFKAKAAAFSLGPKEARPGEIMNVSKEGITVSCEKSNLIIKELQIEGRRVMTAAEFTAGHRISAGEKFGSKN